MTTTIETVPATLDVILDCAADRLANGYYAGAPLVKQAQMALSDSTNISGYSGNELTDVKLTISDLLWNEAGQRNLRSFVEGTHDRRKVERLFRRTARRFRPITDLAR